MQCNEKRHLLLIIYLKSKFLFDEILIYTKKCGNLFDEEAFPKHILFCRIAKIAFGGNLVM